MEESIIIHSEIRGNMHFFVEDYNDTLYLYIMDEAEQKIVASCWLANFAPAPKREDKKSIRLGLPPKLNAEYCLNPGGTQRIKDLTFVWDNNDLVVVSHASVLAFVENVLTEPKFFCKYLKKATNFAEPLPILEGKFL